MRPNAGIIEQTIEGMPRRELIRSRAETGKWNLEDVEYALARVDQLTHSTHQKRVYDWLHELKDELQANQKHREALASNYHAASVSRKAFWISVAALVVALLAWLFPRSAMF